MFSPTFYAEFDPLYRKESLQLVQQIEEIEEIKGSLRGRGSCRKTFELLKEFSSKYLMPKKLWDIKIERTYLFGDNDDRHQIAAEYIYQLGHFSLARHDYIKVSSSRHKKFLDCTEYEYGDRRKFSVEEICYPHDKLEEKWRKYEKHNADSLIPKAVHRKYEKMKILYSKIISTEDGSEEWIKAITEREDYEFIADNVEFRLFENLGNKELWKLYIQYLRTNGFHKKLLETYSKYCRYFLEDSEMLEEYKNAAEKFGPSLVPWKNAKSFEIYDKDFYSLSEIVEIPDTDDVNFVPAPTCHFDPETASSQKFPFRLNLMNYILDNGTASVLNYLYKSCKWFYCYFPIEIIYKLDASTWIGDKICKQSIEILNLQSLKLDNKIYVSTVFKFNFPQSNALSNFMPNIYCCSAKIVWINNQNLTFEQLKFLIGHGEVVDFEMSANDENGNPFKFEDIIVLLPKIQRLEISDTVCYPNISQFLCDFPFQSKIEKFRFGKVEIMPDPYPFAEFILKNASPNGYCQFFFYLKYVDNDGDDYVDIDYYHYNYNYNDFVTTASVFFENTVNGILFKKWKGKNRPVL